MLISARPYLGFFSGSTVVSRIAFALMFLGIQIPAVAIEFVAPVVEAWTWLEDTSNGCKARLGNMEHNRIYVGSCMGRVPHGRGIYFQDLKTKVVRVNNGKIYKTEEISASADVTDFVRDAQRISAFHSIFLLTDDFKATFPEYNSSAIYQAADSFIKSYGGTATAGEMAQAQAKLAEAKVSAYEFALAALTRRQSSQLVNDFLRTWQGKLSSDQEARAKALLVSYSAMEEVARARQAKIDADYEKARVAEEQARQRWRERNFKTACNGYYPGYSASYNRGGFLGTNDAYVVRYVNPSRHTVTIEGTSSGNSLTYGQIVEMSCLDLLERSK